MKNKVVGFLLIASLAVVAYASGAAARSVVGLVSEQPQTRLESTPRQEVDEAPQSELSRPGYEAPASPDWTLSSQAKPLPSEERSLLNVSSLTYNQTPKAAVDTASLAWNCAERSANPSFFIAGVLVDGQTKRMEGTN
jgi:hypothetical protein